jgi:hypothetical protein
MYTLLSTFPLHEMPAGHQDSRIQKNKYAGNASATRDVISPRRSQVRKKLHDRSQV